MLPPAPMNKAAEAKATNAISHKEGVLDQVLTAFVIAESLEDGHR